eukprot:scaffold6215_cov18-Tisochrysis_lutea.AAC.2
MDKNDISLVLRHKEATFPGLRALLAKQRGLPAPEHAVMGPVTGGNVLQQSHHTCKVNAQHNNAHC